MILSTLAINKRKRARKIGMNYLLFSIFLALFAFIYEKFSHNVYSNYMIFAFLFPLLLGFIPFTFLSRKITRYIRIPTYHMAIITFTIGSIMQGILDIYGTTNQLISWYWYFGLTMILITIIMILLQKQIQK